MPYSRETAEIPSCYPNDARAGIGAVAAPGARMLVAWDARPRPLAAASGIALRSRAIVLVPHLAACLVNASFHSAAKASAHFASTAPRAALFVACEQSS